MKVKLDRGAAQSRLAGNARSAAALRVAKNHPEEFAAAINDERAKRGLEPLKGSE